MGGTRRFAVGCLYLSLPVPPHFFGLAQRNGVEPQRKTLMGWWRPREVSGPTRLSHSRGRCHSAAKVSASRTDWITRPRGEGLGLEVDWRLKVFCPAFLQKSGRGPGAEPWPRAAARGTLLMLKKRRRGSKGEPSPGVPPLRAAPAARSSAASAHRRNAGRERTPGGGGTPPLRGGGRNVVRSAETAAAGRRGRRPLQGGCGDVGSAERGSVGGGLSRSSSPQARNISLALASQL